MKYKLIQIANPLHRDEPKKVYAKPVYSGRFTHKQLAKEIAGRSSLTRGDIENVLTNFIDELPTYLKMGLSVKLGDFGTLRLNFSSEGVDSADDFNTSKIKGVRVVFTPSTELKQSLNDITFEEDNSAKL
jgi:predicted histone-like DNA-binding protein